jgi:RNA polymerase primary sigma factor
VRFAACCAESREYSLCRREGVGKVADETFVFRQKLKGLTDLAGEQGMRLDIGQVKKALEGTGLDESKLSLVCDYLLQAGIELTDPDQGEESRSGRRGILELYLEELDRILPVDEKEEFRLFRRASSGDSEARNRLVELYLQTVCDLAGEFDLTGKAGRGQQAAQSVSGRLAQTDPEDLVQEANIGLLLAMDQLSVEDSLSAYRVKILNSVTSYLEEWLRGEEEALRSDRRILRNMNQLADAARELEGENGEKPSAEELSAYLELPLERILDLLRVGGEKMKAEDL